MRFRLKAIQIIGQRRAENTTGKEFQIPAAQGKKILT